MLELTLVRMHLESISALHCSWSPATQGAGRQGKVVSESERGEWIEVR